jgi:hypothetical protein
VLADEAASAADKLAAQDKLDQANLAYSEASSLIEKYEDTTPDGEAMDIADAFLAAQQTLTTAQAAYDADPSADNLDALTQAQKTLQAAKDALSALDTYLQVLQTSVPARELNDTIQQAQLDADAAQAVLDAYAVLASPTATDAEKLAAQAAIDASGMTKAEAESALDSAEQTKTEAEAALAALLTENGYVAYSDVIDAETTTRNALDTAKGTLEAHETTNDAQAAADNAEKRLSDANATYGTISTLMDARDVAANALAAAQIAMDNAYQAWVDARLVAGSDADSEVVAALNGYLDAQKERDEKQAALTAIDEELSLLPSLSEAQDEIDAAQAELDAAELNLAAKLAAQPGVTPDSFGADYAADAATGAEQTTIRAGGDLTITAGADVGALLSRITIAVDGIITVQAGESGTVALASPQTMNVGGINAGTVLLTAYGDILDTAPEGGIMIVADEATLQAIDGGIHGSEAVISVGILSAFADEIDIRNIGALELGTIAAYGTGVTLSASGSIRQLSGGYVQGSRISLTSGGDIGTELTPVIMNTPALVAAGKNIYITYTGHADSIDLTGGNIVLTVGGNLLGGEVHASNLTIDTFGSIGRPGVPLKVWVSNGLTLVMHYGGVYVINLYTGEVERQIRSVFLVGILLSDDDQALPLMLYVLFGVTTRGELSIRNIYIAETGNTEVLSEIAGGVRQSGLNSIDMAFIEGLSEAPQVFAETMSGMFPGMQTMSTSLFWIAAMRADIGDADWNAMIDDLQAVYEATTVEQVRSAVDSFTARWEALYPSVTGRLDTEAEDAEALLSAAEALRNGGVGFAAVINALAELFADPAEFVSCGMDESISQTSCYDMQNDATTCGAFMRGICVQRNAA